VNGRSPDRLHKMQPRLDAGAILGCRARAVFVCRTILRRCARTSSFVALITNPMFYFGGVIFRIAALLSVPAAHLCIRYDAPHQQAHD
jgi:hypothetical protein